MVIVSPLGGPAQQALSQRLAAGRELRCRRLEVGDERQMTNDHILMTGPGTLVFTGEVDLKAFEL